MQPQSQPVQTEPLRSSCSISSKSSSEYLLPAGDSKVSSRVPGKSDGALLPRRVGTSEELAETSAASLTSERSRGSAPLPKFPDFLVPHRANRGGTNLGAPPPVSGEEHSQKRIFPEPQRVSHVTSRDGWLVPQAEPSLARHVGSESCVELREDADVPLPLTQARPGAIVELPSAPALSVSFNVSQLLAGVDELMNLYESMVEARCRGDGAQPSPEADSDEMKEQCAVLHKLALQGMLPPQLTRVYAGKPLESCPLEGWRAAGCPGLQPEELLGVIDQLMQVYEAMVKDSVQVSELQPHECKLDSSIESIEKFKRLHRTGISKSRRRKPVPNGEETKRPCTLSKVSRSTVGGPSMLLEQEDIARALALGAPCDPNIMTEETVLPLKACAQLPCRRNISVTDKVALWSARHLCDLEFELANPVRTISNSEVSGSPPRGSSPASGSPVPAERAPTPPWAGCLLDDPASERPDPLTGSFSLAHMASPEGSIVNGQTSPQVPLAPPASKTTVVPPAPKTTGIKHPRSSGNSSTGSLSSSRDKVMQQVLQKLEQVESSLATERKSTQELAAKYENLLASRAEAYSSDVKLLEEMLAKALKDRRVRAVGSTESGGTSSKRSQSRTLSSSAESSSAGSRYGEKSTRSRTPTSASGSRAASHKSPSSRNSPEVCTKEPRPKESAVEVVSGDHVFLASAAGTTAPEPMLPELQRHFLAASAHTTVTDVREAAEAQETIQAPEANYVHPEGNDDLLKQFAEAAWASRYFGLLPVAALGAILNDLLEAAPQELATTPRN